MSTTYEVSIRSYKLSTLGRFDVSDGRSVERMNDKILVVGIYYYNIILFVHNIPAAAYFSCCSNAVSCIL